MSGRANVPARRRREKIDAAGASRGLPAADRVPASRRTTHALELGPDELARYSRHIILPEVGLDGQRALREARILVVGAGGLGSPLAMYLAAAGVGTLGIVDGDRVDTTNLQRQVLHGEPDIGRSKLASSADAIAHLNSGVEVVRHDTWLSSDNALEIIADYDIVADGTDNFAARYLINDACVLLGKPNVYGSIFRFDGQATVFDPPRGPCYRCLFPEPPPPGAVPSCAEAGVLGVLPGIVGLIQATEVVKLVLGIGDSLVGRLLLYGALEMSFREVRIERDPDCPICGDRPTIRRLIDYEAFCGTTIAADLPPVRTGTGTATSGVTEIEPQDLLAMLEAGEPLALVDVREPQEHTINRLPGAELIPLAGLPEAADGLDPASTIVVYCLTGVRSAAACRMLQDAGFARALNLRGGIRAWIDQIDPSMPRY